MEEFAEVRKEEKSVGWRVEEFSGAWRNEAAQSVGWKDRECGEEQQVEQQQGGVLGRRRWGCSCGWNSRCKAAGGWSWGCCGGEEEEPVWRRALLEEQTSCRLEV